MPTRRFKLSKSMVVFLMMTLLATVNYLRSIYINNRMARLSDASPDILTAEVAENKSFSASEYSDNQTHIANSYKFIEYSDSQSASSNIKGSFEIDNNKIFAIGTLLHNSSTSLNISDPTLKDWQKRILAKDQLSSRMLLDGEGCDSSALIHDRQNNPYLMKSYGGLIHIANYAVFNAAMEVATQQYPDFYKGDNIFNLHREMAPPKLVAVEIAKHDFDSLYSVGVVQPFMDSLISLAEYSKNTHGLLSEDDDHIAHLVKVIGGAIGVSDLTERNFMKTGAGGFAVPDVGNCVHPGVILGGEAENDREAAFLRVILSSPAVGAAMDFKSSMLSIQDSLMFAAYNKRAKSIMSDASESNLLDEEFSKANSYNKATETHDLDSILVDIYHNDTVNVIPKSGRRGYLGLVDYINIFKTFNKDSLMEAMNRAEDEYQLYTTRMSEISDGRQVAASSVRNSPSNENLDSWPSYSPFVERKRNIDSIRDSAKSGRDNEIL